MSELLIPGDLTTRSKVITGLRQLADYLDAHPDLPVGVYGWDLNVYPGRDNGDPAARADVDKIAAVLGVPVTDRTGQGGHYTASRRFGLVTYSAVHVPARRMADHYALMTYSGSVTPERAEVTP